MPNVHFAIKVLMIPPIIIGWEQSMSIDRVKTSNQGIDRSQAAQGSERVRSSQSEMDRLTNTVQHSRSERLNEIRQALQAGTYRVSAEDIAKSLIDANKRED
jgi:anti-sigma28 factor (negative regulator of flagellin synthesis)